MFHGLHMDNIPAVHNLDHHASKDPKHRLPCKVQSFDSAHLPSWKREPNPLPGWTSEDQHALILGSKHHLKERSSIAIRGIHDEFAHWQYVRLVARYVPNKTLEECDLCIKHVERERIAYFGPVEHGRQQRGAAVTPRDVKPAK